MSSSQADLMGMAVRGLPPAGELGAEATALAERLFPILPYTEVSRATAFAMTLRRRR